MNHETQEDAEQEAVLTSVFGAVEGWFASESHSLAWIPCFVLWVSKSGTARSQHLDPHHRKNKKIPFHIPLLVKSEP